MTIIKNNIEIAKIYRGINSIGKIYAGDKLVFGGGVTPTPTSSVLVYNEASPSKLTLKAGTYKATVFNPETGEETIQDYVLASDTDIEMYDKPYTSFDMTNKTDRLYQFNTADGSSWINNKNEPAKGLDKLNTYIVPEGKMNIAYDGELNLSYSRPVSYQGDIYNSMSEIDTFASAYNLTSGKTYNWSFGQKAVYNIPAGKLFEFDVSLNKFLYKTETVPTCTISLTDINTGDVLYTRDQKVNYRSSSDSLFYYGYWSYTHLPPLANVGGKTIALNITYNNLKYIHNPDLNQQITPKYSISGKLYDPSTPDPVTVDIMDFGEGRPDISVRTYREEQAERFPNGLCGTVHFDSEMNVASVT